MSEKNIKIFKFVNGQEIIAEIVGESDSDVTLRNVLALHQQMKPNTSELALGLAKFLPFCGDEEITFQKEFLDKNVMLVYNPINDIKRKYQEAFSSIVLPNNTIGTPGIING